MQSQFSRDVQKRCCKVAWVCSKKWTVLKASPASEYSRREQPYMATLQLDKLIAAGQIDCSWTN
jgi:hypothetical protein